MWLPQCVSTDCPAGPAEILENVESTGHWFQSANDLSAR